MQDESGFDGSTRSLPIATVVVDLDGTLVRTDTLHESVLKVVRSHPGAIVSAFMRLKQGRAAFKSALAQVATPDPTILPYDESVLAYLRARKDEGAKLILATAADRVIAEGAASHLGMFDHVIASANGRNLKGRAKLEAIRELVGEDDFAYIGDSRADLPIWSAAASAVVVGPLGSRLANELARNHSNVEFIERKPTGWRDLVRASRLYQWLKNVLVFLPLLTSLRFLEAEAIGYSLVAFFAFGCLASAGYIVNDLLDMEADRLHPRKRGRPFASGLIGAGKGTAFAAVLLTSGIAFAGFLGLTFLLVAAAYLCTTLGYSLVLKRYVFMDVLTLAFLYTVRVLGGAVAIAVQPSVWLLGFSALVFFSLALVKRVAELLVRKEQGAGSLKGRDYAVSDLPILIGFGTATAAASVVVYIIFASSVEQHGGFAQPALLWPGALVLLYWLARMWVKTIRNEMTDDPIVFTVKDRGSRLIVIMMAALFIAAAVDPVGVFGASYSRP